jgi:hypothetical protein
LVVRYEHYFATKNIIVRRQKKLCTAKKKCASQHRHKRIWRRTKKTTNSSTQFNTRKKYPFTRVAAEKFPVLRQKSATKCCSVTTKCRYILSIKKVWVARKKTGFATTHPTTPTRVIPHTITLTYVVNKNY